MSCAEASLAAEFGIRCPQGSVVPGSATEESFKPKPNKKKHKMKKLLLTTIGLAAVTLAGVNGQTPFTAGNIVVNRLGDGTTALSGASTNITIQEFTISGSAVQSISIPGTGAGAVSDSGTATSNGYINTFGNTLFVPGYQTAVGTASVTGTATTAVPRAVVSVGANGTIGSTSLGGTGWTGNNFRSTIGVGGLLFGSGTASGTNGGVRYFNGANSTVRISSTVTNVRNLESYGGELMFSTASGTTGIYTLGAVSSLDLSTADANAATLLIPSTSAYGFYINSTLGVAFIADDGITASQGIRRFDFNTITSTWDETWSFRLDSATNAFSSLTSGVISVRGLAVEYDASVSLFNVYATTTQASNNQLISFSDGLVSTLQAGDNYTVLASAGTNYVYRGVDFAPIPEPATWVLLLIGASAVVIRRKLGPIKS